MLYLLPFGLCTVVTAAAFDATHCDGENNNSHNYTHSDQQSLIVY